MIYHYPDIIQSVRKMTGASGWDVYKWEIKGGFHYQNANEEEDCPWENGYWFPEYFYDLFWKTLVFKAKVITWNQRLVVLKALVGKSYTLVLK